MKQRKLYMLLSLLLVIGCLVTAIGITFARYRTQWNGHMGFQAEKVGRLHLGTLDGSHSFTAAPAAWSQTENGWQMPFAVANGLSDSDYTRLDQRVQVQLVASQGAWHAGSNETVTLTVGERVYTATASPIPQGSTLHGQFGDGWVFRFRDENGNPYSGELPGGSFACVSMLLTVSGTATEDASLLQLQVMAEVL